jgi:hypothetical protein
MSARCLLLASVFGATPLAAQTLEQRIARAPDGLVRLSFPAREGVCGNGRSINWPEANNRDGWSSECDSGPVRVAIEVQGGRVGEVRTYVGGRWRQGDREATDLGTVPARAAGEYFLALAESGRDVKGDPLLPAVLADSITIWPQLIRIGKNPAVKSSVRKQAVFWLSQEASAEATRGLAELAEGERENQDVRKQAVFALSQLRNGAGIPTMIKLARTDPDPAIRQQAIFWLGQSGDPRAVEFFEAVLTRRR